MKRIFTIGFKQDLKKFKTLKRLDWYIQYTEEELHKLLEMDQQCQKTKL